MRIRSDWEILIIFIMLIISILGFNLYIDTIKINIFNPPFGFENNSVGFEVIQFAIDETENFEIEELEDFINVNYGNSNFKIINEYINNYNNGGAVYFSDFSNLKLKFLEGRNFNSNDILNNTNTILLSQSAIDKSYERDNKKYYSFDGDDFEVVGIYKDANNTKDFYINLFSESFLDNFVIGNFIVEINNDNVAINDFIENIKEIHKDIYIENSINYSDYIIDNLIAYLKGTWSFTLIGLAPLLLVILNSKTIITNFILNNHIFIEINNNYGCPVELIINYFKNKILKIAIISYIIGLLLFFIFSILGIIEFGNNTILISEVLLDTIIFIIIVIIYIVIVKKEVKRCVLCL